MFAIRNAQKAYKNIRSFCKQMKKSCGMDCVVLGFHKDEKGSIVLKSLSSLHYCSANIY